jgi:hypothetical protein
MAKTTTTHGVQSMNYHVPSVVDGSPISVRRWLPPPEVNTKPAATVASAFVFQID